MKILLTSVFKPFGIDDIYGRKENRLELFHNQATREQGLFSPRWYSQSYGLYFIAENINVPTTVLDFPSEKRFIKEIKKGFDYVGISFIVPNFLKAKRMAQLVRHHAPHSRIILGGHGTRIPGIEETIEHDYVCREEGVRWLRRLLGENPDRPFKHPALYASLSKRHLGIPTKSDSAVLIPGVGCPNACRFCATSHFFDRKYIPFFPSGKELFHICEEVENRLGCQEFSVMDENFLKQSTRAKELLHLMEKNNKLYRFSFFSSADTIAEVGIEFLVRLGVRFIWIGVESKYDLYEKNKGLDLKKMIHDLREHGIVTLVSAILFVEHHDKNTIWDDIKFTTDLKSDFVQFMQLGPMPGTKLYHEYELQGYIKKHILFEEWHGQHRIWFKHPQFTLKESERILREAFLYDYSTHGSSLLRSCDTTIRGYRHLAHFKDPWITKRRESLRAKARAYRPALEVMKRYAHNERVRQLTEEVITRYDEELGPMTLKQRMMSKVALVYAARESARIASGRDIYQPKTLTTNYKPVAENSA